MESQLAGASRFNRRRFVQSAAVAAAGVTGPLAWPARGAASDNSGVEDQQSVVPPQPIPGGFAPGIHVWAPGDPTVTLPLSKTKLMGFDVDPTTILDFRGFSAVAFHVGTATDGDGKTYNLETDLRAFKGKYVASDGTLRSGAFAFIWVDLYEPSSGSHLHDFNGGILASGFFWTHPVDDEALRFSDDGRRAVLEVENEGVIDSFDFGNPAFLEGTPGVVSLRVEWRATGPATQRGKDSTVPATDPAAFVGRFAVAESTAEITGSEFGFSFRSDPGVNTASTFAEIGRERNGSFL